MAVTPSDWESTSVAALLARQNGDDLAAMLADLLELLVDVVPRAEVKRSLLRRHVTHVRLPLGAHIYVLERRRGDAYVATRQQSVRDVVIRTDPMELPEWVAELGAAIDAELARSERARDALRRWMESAGR